MALLDAYATAQQFRDARGDVASGYSASLELGLITMSRLLERRLRVAPGGWNDSGSDTRVFDAHGGQILWLRDREGRAYFLQTATYSVGIDSEGDLTYDGYTIDQDDTFLRGIPDNNSDHSEPFHSLELLPFMTSATVTSWPDRVSSVRITGSWGWPEVPPIITELVIHRTGELIDAQKAGSTGELASFDGGIPMQPNTAWLFKQAEEEFSRKIPVF